MARATFVKKARKDIPQAGIKAGESYYWWQFRMKPRGSRKCFSKTPPRRSQLTQSSYRSQVYDIQDNAAKMPTEPDDLAEIRDEIVSGLEGLKEEIEGNLENMPDGLREGDTGQLIQARIDSLESVISDIENVDLEFDASNRPEGSDENEYREAWMDGQWSEVMDALNAIEG